MGKRIEKAFGRDKGQASAGSQENEDDPNKPPGMYQCRYFKVLNSTRTMYS